MFYLNVIIPYQQYHLPVFKVYSGKFNMAANWKRGGS